MSEQDKPITDDQAIEIFVTIMDNIGLGDWTGGKCPGCGHIIFMKDEVKEYCIYQPGTVENKKGKKFKVCSADNSDENDLGKEVFEFDEDTLWEAIQSVVDLEVGEFMCFIRSQLEDQENIGLN